MPVRARSQPPGRPSRKAADAELSGQLGQFVLGQPPNRISVASSPRTMRSSPSGSSSIDSSRTARITSSWSA
jgi:hypothetical protein